MLALGRAKDKAVPALIAKFVEVPVIAGVVPMLKEVAPTAAPVVVIVAEGYAVEDLLAAPKESKGKSIISREKDCKI